MTLRKTIISACLLLVGIIHLLPLSGVLGVDQLQKLYGITFAENNLAILMRHRAVLFGISGAFMITAAFKPKFQLAATIMGLLSVFSFITITWLVGDYNAAIQKVVWVDWVAAALLIISLALNWVNFRKAD